jgi:hypothetical protein
MYLLTKKKKRKKKDIWISKNETGCSSSSTQVSLPYFPSHPTPPTPHYHPLAPASYPHSDVRVVVSVLSIPTLRRYVHNIKQRQVFRFFSKKALFPPCTSSCGPCLLLPFLSYVCSLRLLLHICACSLLRNVGHFKELTPQVCILFCLSRHSNCPNDY